jgi:hypothetical protein
MTLAAAAPEPDPERVTELALALADLVRRLPEADRRAVARLAAQSIAVPSRARRREDLLGLLAELARGGVWVTTIEYEEERACRRAQGQEWPAHTTIIARYSKGSKKRGDAWRKAVKAAARLAAYGSVRRVTAGNSFAGYKKAYSRDEVTALIREFYWRHGTWPTQWEYSEWARGRRMDLGPSARLPGRDQIRKLFGSWARALEIAMREEGETDAGSRSA